MIKTLSLIALFPAILIACTPSDSHQHNTPVASDITLGNGALNSINHTGAIRQGPTLIIPEVIAAQDSFLVLHPFKNGAAVKTDYVGAAYVPAGTTADIAVRLDDTPNRGEAFIIMLHADVNGDGAFQFGDGVTVADAPVLEGSTLIASRMEAPMESPVTPALIRTSAKEHAAKADSFAERAAYRDDALMARARALTHHYLAIVEGESRSGEAARPLFTDDFIINFPSGPITTIEGLNTWLTGPAASLEATRHVLQDVRITPLSESRHRLRMVMVWDGLTTDGKRMTAMTRHRWVIQDTGDALKIERIDVKIIEPFEPANWD